jgi:hypothetical protein
VLDNVSAGNAHGWSVQSDAIYYLEEVGEAIQVRRAPLTGGESRQVATLTHLTWPGFSIASDGAVLYARWERRESNLMSLEY